MESFFFRTRFIIWILDQCFSTFRFHLLSVYYQTHFFSRSRSSSRVRGLDYVSRVRRNVFSQQAGVTNAVFTMRCDCDQLYVSA